MFNLKIAIISVWKAIQTKKLRKKNYAKAVKLREEIKTSVRILMGLDKQMSSAGIGRQQRRAFWREFGQSEHNREHVLKSLLGHLKIEDVPQDVPTKEIDK